MNASSGQLANLQFLLSSILPLIVNHVGSSLAPNCKNQKSFFVHLRLKSQFKLKFSAIHDRSPFEIIGKYAIMLQLHNNKNIFSFFWGYPPEGNSFLVTFLFPLNITDNNVKTQLGRALFLSKHSHPTPYLSSYLPSGSFVICCQDVKFQLWLIFQCWHVLEFVRKLDLWRCFFDISNMTW